MGKNRTLQIWLLSGILLYAQASVAIAQESSMFCNARRYGGAHVAASGRTDFDRKCYAIALDLLREATGQDHNLNEAEGIFGTLLSLYPESAYPHMGHAELHMRRRELHLLGAEPIHRILESAVRATRIKPVIPLSYVTLGRAQLFAGCLPCAEKSAATAQELLAQEPELRMLQSLIAELRGDVGGAVARLNDTLRATSLRPETISGTHLALAALYNRARKFDDAEEEFAKAISSAPQYVTPQLRYAEFLLYERGDTRQAAAAAAKADALVASIAARRVAALAEYLAWARDYPGGRSSEQIKRIAQVSIVPPDEAFVLAARHSSLSIISGALLKAGVVSGTEARDSDGNTALIAAGIGGNTAIAKELVASRANVNAKNTLGERPLALFIRNGDRDVAISLLKAGAEINYVDNDGNSPLSLAVQKRDAQMVLELMRRKAKILTEGGWSAGDLLSAAAMTDDTQTAKALLDNGVMVDSLDRSGHPALIAAVLWGSKAMVQLLLEHGADAESAMDTARQSGNREILDILRAARRRST